MIQIYFGIVQLAEGTLAIGVGVQEKNSFLWKESGQAEERCLSQLSHSDRAGSINVWPEFRK